VQEVLHLQSEDVLKSLNVMIIHITLSKKIAVSLCMVTITGAQITRWIYKDGSWSQICNKSCVFRLYPDNKGALVMCLQW